MEGDRHRRRRRSQSPEKAKHRENFLPGRREEPAGAFNFDRFSFRQALLFIAECPGQAHDRDGRLDLAGALHEAIRLDRNAHGSAGHRAKRVHAAAPVLVQGRAREIAEPFHDGVQLSVTRPLSVRCLPQAGKFELDGLGLVARACLDVIPHCRGECGQASLQLGHVQNRDRKRADAASAAPAPAR